MKILRRRKLNKRSGAIADMAITTARIGDVVTTTVHIVGDADTIAPTDGGAGTGDAGIGGDAIGRASVAPCLKASSVGISVQTLMRPHLGQHT